MKTNEKGSKKKANKWVTAALAVALGVTGGTASLIGGVAMAAPPAPSTPGSGDKPMKPPAPPRDKQQTAGQNAIGDNEDCAAPKPKPEGGAERRPQGAPPAPPAGRGNQAAPPAGTDNQAAPPAAPGPDTAGQPTVTNGVSVVISGGHNTDPQDHGRPVVLIAAALGVPTEVFREAFNGVTPAGLERGPTEDEARSNKAALLKVLAPYGITNDRLDEVSNYYRYNGTRESVWRHTNAAAVATVVDGVVTGISITNPGSGYSSAPTVTVTGPNGSFTATAELSYGSDFGTNGSIASIQLP
jgi:hypothetical protein